MGSTLTTRISDELDAEITRISEEEHLDKSAVTRRLLEDAVKRYRLETALERYEAGEVSLRKAASIAQLPLRVFLKKLPEHGVHFRYGIEDLEKDYQAAVED